MKVTKRKRSHTPWLELSHAAADYLDPATIPEGFNICDPSKLTKAQIDGLWAHWRAQAEKKLPIFRFIKAKRNDIGLVGSSETVQRPPKQKPYVEVSDDDEDEQDALEDVRQEEGTLSSTSKPPPSKRSRLSGQYEEAEDQSPAANGSDRIKFLYSLSKDSSYTAVVDALMALPIFVSLLFLRWLIQVVDNLLRLPPLLPLYRKPVCPNGLPGAGEKLIFPQKFILNRTSSQLYLLHCVDMVFQIITRAPLLSLALDYCCGNVGEPSSWKKMMTRPLNFCECQFSVHKVLSR